MLASLIELDPSEPAWRTLVRRLLLLLTTWLTAHIYNLLCDISDAVDAHADQAPADGSSSSAVQCGDDQVSQAASAGAGRPGRAAKPTLKAGSSIPYVDPSRASESPQHHAWTSIGADQFRVRCGPDYPRNGNKAPSGPALGDVVAVDLLRTDKKIFDLLALNHIELPAPTPGWSEIYPELFVVNQMMPVKFHNSLITSDKTDGETWNLITYVRLRPGLANGWAQHLEPQGAEQLAARFVMRAAHDPAVAHCFKEIGLVRNLDELAQRFPRSLFGILKKYNGKPILTRPEHYFTRDPDNRYFMVDLDTHRYKYLTRTALHTGFGRVEEVASTKSGVESLS